MVNFFETVSSHCFNDPQGCTKPQYGNKKYSAKLGKTLKYSFDPLMRWLYGALLLKCRGDASLLSYVSELDLWGHTTSLLTSKNAIPNRNTFN